MSRTSSIHSFSSENEQHNMKLQRQQRARAKHYMEQLNYRIRRIQTLSDRQVRILREAIGDMHNIQERLWRREDFIESDSESDSMEEDAPENIESESSEEEESSDSAGSLADFIVPDNSDDDSIIIDLDDYDIVNRDEHLPVKPAPPMPIPVKYEGEPEPPTPRMR